MILKATYIGLALASLALMFFEAPRGALLTSSPDKGKVERQATQNPSGSGNATVRMPYFVFIGGYHGGK